MALRRTPGRLFVISSPSGGGKTTVVERLCRMMPRLVRSVSVTTRSPRPGERQGREYRFVTRAAFWQLLRRKELIEWAKVHGACYGTPKRPLLKAIARGRDVILSIDVKGARQVRRYFGRQAILIFLMPPSMRKLQQRLMQRRTDTTTAIRKRLAAAKRELACASWYDATVVNDRLQRTVEKIAAIISARQR
jgi:guanylate kinase